MTTAPASASAAQPAHLSRWESEGGAGPGNSDPSHEISMLHPYTMSFLDRLDVSILRREFVALDDSAAISHAVIFSKTHVIEILQGERIIARIPKGSMGLGPIERLDPHSATERPL